MIFRYFIGLIESIHNPSCTYGIIGVRVEVVFERYTGEIASVGDTFCHAFYHYPCGYAG